MFKFLRPLVVFLSLAGCARLQGADSSFLPRVQRIVFLGDSITQAGHYVDDFEAFLFTRFPERKFEVINVGLSSETASGLSEPGHAGGKFPRPWVHERLDRVLAKTRPDLVFACYGMNDGIYLPLDEQRLAKFREGISLLHQKVTAAGSQIIHLTPPVFEGAYNTTLDAYSKWLLDQRAQGWQVIDLHGPMNQALADGRAHDPAFHFAGDHVHPNTSGHWVMAEALLKGLGYPSENFTVDPLYRELLETVHQRNQLLLLAWLTETGHTRPGIPRGLPLDQAQKQATDLESKIRALSKPLVK